MRPGQESTLRWAGALVTIGALLVTLIPIDSAMAFNDQRRGFILGGGAGLGFASVHYNSAYRSDVESLGFQTAFIIGGGVSDQFTISYTGLQLWGSQDYDEVGFALLPSVEARYFLSPVAPSTFWTLGFGLAVYDDNLGDWGIGAGLAPHVGFGYEFKRHYSAELHLAYTLGDVDRGHKPLFNLMLLVTALAY